MVPRPRLRADHRPLQRSADSVQLGLVAGQALVLSGLRRGEMSLLQLLDGRHTLAELYAVAARLRVGRARVDALLELLHTRGLLAPADPDRLSLWHAAQALGDRSGAPSASVVAARGLPTARLARQVLVGGRGPLPQAIASTLREAGVGQVEVGPWAMDHAELELRDAEPPHPPDLVVLTSRDALDPRCARAWRRHRVALLPVVATESTVAIGPLVGTDPAGVCLRCVELHRTDRDECWPLLLAQACPEGGGALPVTSEPTLTTTAAGLSAMVAAGYLDGRSIPPGLVLELGLPLPRLEHRIWPRHPQCADHGRHQHTPARVTMSS